MSHWIVSNVSSRLVLLGLVVLIAGGSVLILLYVRRRFPRLTQDAHNDVTGFAFGVVAFKEPFMSYPMVVTVGALVAANLFLHDVIRFLSPGPA